MGTCCTKEMIMCRPRKKLPGEPVITLVPIPIDKCWLQRVAQDTVQYFDANKSGQLQFEEVKQMLISQPIETETDKDKDEAGVRKISDKEVWQWMKNVGGDDCQAICRKDLYQHYKKEWIKPKDR